MKNLKNLVPVFALVFGLAIVFTQSAFKTEQLATLTYQFIGDNETELTDVTKWRAVTAQNPSSCEQGNEIPCVVQFDSGSHATIDAYLTANPTKEDMATTTVSQRDEN